MTSGGSATEESRSSTFTLFLRELDLTKGISFRSLESQEHVEAMAKFVHSLASWKVFATHTFRWNASVASAGRVYRRFMDRSLPSVSYFFAVETHPGGHGGHVHAIWDSAEAPRIATHREWLKRYGRNRIEPVRSFVDVVDYCAKYVCKDSAWWDFHLSRSQYAKLRQDKFFPHLPFGKNSSSLFHGSAPVQTKQPACQMGV